MKRALVFQHMDHDHPGRFLDFFSEDGIVPEMVRLWEGQEIPNLAPYDFLFVLGGAQDTWQENEHSWMLAEKAAIREWVWDRAKPYFGVCLGHQLLCDALGGEVALAAEPEVGVFDVSLTDDGKDHGLFCRIGKQQQGDAVALGRSDAGTAGSEGSCHHRRGQPFSPLPSTTTPSARSFIASLRRRPWRPGLRCQAIWIRWKSRMAKAPIAGWLLRPRRSCRRWQE